MRKREAREMWQKCKVLLVALTALALLAVPFGSAFANTSQNVTVTLTPAYLTVALGVEDDWGFTAWTNTTYYSNPEGFTTPPSATVVDGECRFDLDPTGSTVDMDVYVNFSNFTGGGGAMTNTNDGSNGEDTFGAYSWYSGLSYANKVVAKSSGSDALKTGHDKSTTLKWGVEVLTRTNAWSSGEASSATVTISVLPSS